MSSSMSSSPRFKTVPGTRMYLLKSDDEFFNMLRANEGQKDCVTVVAFLQKNNSLCVSMSFMFGWYSKKFRNLEFYQADPDTLEDAAEWGNVGDPYPAFVFLRNGEKCGELVGVRPAILYECLKGMNSDPYFNLTAATRRQIDPFSPTSPSRYRTRVQSTTSPIDPGGYVIEEEEEQDRNQLVVDKVTGDIVSRKELEERETWRGVMLGIEEMVKEVSNALGWWLTSKVLKKVFSK